MSTDYDEYSRESVEAALERLSEALTYPELDDLHHLDDVDAELRLRMEKLTERIHELEARLEIDYALDHEGHRVEIPAHVRKTFPDGIMCRDETIRLQDEEIRRLKKEIAELQ